MKEIITYEVKKKNENCNQHPNTDNRISVETNGLVILTETAYVTEDGVCIGVVEFPDTYSQSEMNEFKKLDTDFKFKFISESKANKLLADLGDVTISNFEFTDNRPQDNI